MFATCAVGALFLGFVLWHYLAYNSLVNARTAVTQTWSNTEVELKRRLDLIGNLIEVVKGYASYEADTLQSVVKERKAAGPTVDVGAANAEASMVRGALSKIFAVAESYPDLKANNQFLQLQHALTETENRIAERRQAYNATVSGYRIVSSTFPTSIVAWVHEFGEAAFFDAPDEDINAPIEVKLR